jgi:hypothetical protein
MAPFSLTSIEVAGLNVPYLAPLVRCFPMTRGEAISPCPKNGHIAPPLLLSYAAPQSTVGNR